MPPASQNLRFSGRHALKTARISWRYKIPRETGVAPSCLGPAATSRDPSIEIWTGGQIRPTRSQRPNWPKPRRNWPRSPRFGRIRWKSFKTVRNWSESRQNWSKSNREFRPKLCRCRTKARLFLTGLKCVAAMPASCRRRRYPCTANARRPCTPSSRGALRIGQRAPSACSRRCHCNAAR